MNEMKAGDYIRIVVEGEVAQMFGDGYTKVSGTNYPPVGKCGVVSIEVISPPFVLPTKRWAQVLDGEHLWTRVGLDTDDFLPWLVAGGDWACTNTELLEYVSRLRVISEGVEDE